MSAGGGPSGGPPRGTPLALAGIGIELALYLGVGAYAGYVVDGWLGTWPWMFLVGSVAGMAAGFLMLFRRVLSSGRGPGDESGAR